MLGLQLYPSFALVLSILFVSCEKQLSQTKPSLKEKRWTHLLTYVITILTWREHCLTSEFVPIFLSEVSWRTCPHLLLCWLLPYLPPAFISKLLNSSPKQSILSLGSHPPLKVMLLLLLIPPNGPCSLSCQNFEYVNLFSNTLPQLNLANWFQPRSHFFH